jgi:hypothetical protein
VRCDSCGMKECCGATLGDKLAKAKEEIRVLQSALFDKAVTDPGWKIYGHTMEEIRRMSTWVQENNYSKIVEQVAKLERVAKQMAEALEDIVSIHMAESTKTTCCKMDEKAQEALAAYRELDKK